MADSEVNVKLSVESSAFEAGLESARDGLQDLGAEAKGAGAEAAKAGDGFEELGEDLNDTGDKAGKAGEDVESFGAEAKTTGDKAAKAGDGVEDLGDELKVTGDKAAKAGDGVEDLGGETRELVGKLNQAKSAVSDFAARLKAAENPDFLDGLADKVEDVAQKLALFAGGLALAGSKATQGFLTAAADMEAYQMTLAKVTGSTAEATRLLGRMQGMAAKTPFDVAGIVDAGVKLKSFGQDVDRFLPLAADLAAVFQRDVGDVALGLGKALAGSQDGLTILNDGLGITKRELAAAGAHMTSAGAIALETADDLTALANAIEKVAQQKNFAGAAEDMAEGMKGAFSNVEDAWNQLQASLGGQLKNEAQGIAGMIGGIAEALNALPEPIQKAAAYAVVAGTAASTAVSVGAGMVGVLANVTTALATTGAGTVLLTAAKKKLIGAMLGVQLQGGLTAAAMASISVAALASVAVVAAAGVALAVYTDILKDNTKAQEELLAIEEKRAQLGRENKDLIGKTAEQVLAMGKTEKDVVHAINLLHEQAQAARAAGNNVLEEQLKRQIADLQRVKVELSERAAQEAKSAGLSVATWEDYSKRVSAGFFETKAAQLQALDAVIAAQKKAGKDTADAELARVALVRQVTEEKLKSAEQEKNAVKKAAEDRLNTELHALKLEEAAGRLTDEQKAARLRGLLASYRETAIGREKLRDLELEASKLEGQAATKAEEEKRSAAAAALASKLQAIDMERARHLYPQPFDPGGDRLPAARGGAAQAGHIRAGPGRNRALQPQGSPAAGGGVGPAAPARPRSRTGQRPHRRNRRPDCRPTGQDGRRAGGRPVHGGHPPGHRGPSAREAGHPTPDDRGLDPGADGGREGPPGQGEAGRGGRKEEGRRQARLGAGNPPRRRGAEEARPGPGQGQPGRGRVHQGCRQGCPGDQAASR